VSTVAPSPTAVRQRTHPVIEVFGPTIQGEGAEAGVATHFVRFGGCDYRCTWCDTMYAVDPATVRQTSESLSDAEIVSRLQRLDRAPEWVTLSGGNPALHHLDDLVDQLQDEGFKVAVETQGSLWRAWLGRVDRLTISPKPPSSSMATEAHARQFADFMSAATVAADRSVLKIVCFNDVDVEWAKAQAACWPALPVFLSAGTPIPSPPDVRSAVGERYRWLCERVAGDADLARARVLPQLHVIAWEGAKGV
jgi:7-carboxy-7-deazaguanine synthase